MKLTDAQYRELQKLLGVHAHWSSMMQQAIQANVVQSAYEKVREQKFKSEIAIEVWIVKL